MRVGESVLEGWTLPRYTVDENGEISSATPGLAQRLAL